MPSKFNPSDIILSAMSVNANDFIQWYVDGDDQDYLEHKLKDKAKTVTETVKKGWNRIEGFGSDVYDKTHQKTADEWENSPPFNGHSRYKSDGTVLTYKKPPKMPSGTLYATVINGVVQENDYGVSSKGNSIQQVDVSDYLTKWIDDVWDNGIRKLGFPVIGMTVYKGGKAVVNVLVDIVTYRNNKWDTVLRSIDGYTICQEYGLFQRGKGH